MEELFGEDQKGVSETYGEWSIRLPPFFEYKMKDKVVSIVQNSIGKGELGTRVWDGSSVLSRYIETNFISLIGMIGIDRNGPFNLIELGAGCGLVGIVSSLVSSSLNVTITDKQSLLPLIRENVQRNCLAGRVTDCELFWGTERSSWPECVRDRDFHFIVGADLTYDFEDLPPLLHTIKTLAFPSKTLPNGGIVLIAYGQERAATPRFFQLAQEDFDIIHIDKELDHSDIQFPTFTIAIAVMRLKKK